MKLWTTSVVALGLAVLVGCEGESPAPESGPGAVAAGGGTPAAATAKGTKTVKIAVTGMV